MKQQHFVLIAAMLLLSSISNAQIAINTTAASPDGSAMLDVSSSGRGILIPRMTNAYMTGISSPATGLMVYQTDGTPGFYYYTGGNWQQVGNHAFNDTLTQNLFTNGMLLSGDGTTGINMSGNGIMVDKGNFGSGTGLTESGAATKMIWYPQKGAFRAGQVTGPDWDDERIGLHSMATGYNTTANGTYATAMGNGTTAAGIGATAMGANSFANGDYSTAMGTLSIASGYSSVAMGYSVTATNDYSFATGKNTTASGLNSTAMGDHAAASGDYSTAIGAGTEATGQYATALGVGARAWGDNSIALGTSCTAFGDNTVAIGGNVSTNNKAGSFNFGDQNGSGLSFALNSLSNQMMMRFSGGYILYSNSNLTTGTQLAPGANSWSTISDRRKKENFANVDGEDFLKKIDALSLTSWNYKGQDAKIFRHYGPMAQDFYAAFGKDSYGVIGNDTTINQADFEGVSFIAIQALEKRTAELQKQVDQLAMKNKELQNKLVNKDHENEALKTEVTEQNKEILTRLETLEASVNDKNKEITVK